MQAPAKEKASKQQGKRRKRIMSTTSTNDTKKGINLDELQGEVEKLLALLKDREPGYMGWCMFMNERLTNLHALTSKALGKDPEPEKQGIVSTSNIISIDRTKPFDPVAFIGKGWSFWRGPIDGNGLEGDMEQDERSLAITEVDLNKIHPVTTLKGKEKGITGEENLRRLKASGDIRLDAKVLETFWGNQHLILESWKEKTNGLTTYIFFDGTFLRSPSGNRSALYLFFDGGQWYWYYLWLGHGRSVSSPSVVSASS